MDAWQILTALGGTLTLGSLWKFSQWVWKWVVLGQKFFAEVKLGISTIHRIESRTQSIDARQVAMMNLIERPIFISDNHGRFVQVNHDYEQLTGYSERELLGEGWLTAVHSSDRETVWEEWHHAVTQNRIFKSTHRYVHREGYQIIARVEAHPIRLVDGSVFGFQGVINIRAANNPLEAAKLVDEEIP